MNKTTELLNKDALESAGGNWYPERSDSSAPKRSDSSAPKIYIKGEPPKYQSFD